MDPVSALSLAANIYAFVEAGFKAVSLFNDIRRNGLRETRDNTERRAITEDLETISNELATQSSPFLKDVGENCSKLSKELLELLDKLIIKKPGSVRERVAVVYRSYRRSSDISSLESRLDTYRRQLMVNLLHTLRDDQSEFKQQFDFLRDDLKQLRDPRSTELTKLRSDLLEAIQELPEHTSAQLLNNTFNSLLSQIRDIVQVSGPEVAVLKRLRFSDIHSREDAIKGPTEGTFAWPVGETRTTLSGVERLFTSWLESGSGVFHISGKAGSGKSTLMKHIWLHDRTEERLKTWAGDKKLLRSAFFFWAAGNDDQKSLTGLFRSILFTVLSQDPSLIPDVFPECWGNGQFTPSSLDRLTRPDIIESAFRNLLGKATGGKYRICLFIDGLDEYEAPDRESYWDLAKRLGDWVDDSHGDIKLCVSSRPYIEFQDTFSPCQHRSREQIHLHQLNRSDIEKHCQTTLSEAKELHGISDPTKARSFACQIENSRGYLVREIGDRAEGVFLWAVLVVRMIISEAKRGGSDEDLMKKLKETPDGIDELYAKMLGSLKRSERQMSNRLLYVILTNPFRQNVNALCLKWLTSKDAWQSRVPRRDSDYAEKDAMADIDYVTQHLDIWAQGLVETQHLNAHYTTSDVPNSHLFATRVKVSHRSVRDYLLHSTQLLELRSAFEGFDVARLHTNIRLTELAIWNHMGTSDTTKNIHDYAYQILEPKTHLRPDPVGNLISDFQVTWSDVQEIGRLLPACYPLRAFEWMDSFIAIQVSKSDQTFQNHLAASLRLNDEDVIEGFMHAESELGPRSVLLSACLSNLYFRNSPLVGKVSTQGLIRALVKRGFTANKRMKPIASSRQFLLRCPADSSATVWMIVLSNFVKFIETRSPSAKQIEATEIIHVLCELLRNERQEEVLLLGCTNVDVDLVKYDCFATLEDFLCGSGIMSTNAIPDQLRGWPKYEGGGPRSPGAPTWIWRIRRSLVIHPMSRDLRKLTAEEIKAGECSAVKFFWGAIVSRKDFLEDVGTGGPKFMLW
ncbi:hypothetical protein F5Y10DRAFT_203305 [Nemania abortiva]|nr:hypothetical protein F5Y10DRAFT_203305 [Nemania abortiva]